MFSHFEALPVHTRPQILTEIAAIAAETLDWRGSLDEGTELVANLGLDSLRALSLLIELENRLQVSLQPEDEKGLVTVGDLISAVLSRQERAPSP